MAKTQNQPKCPSTDEWIKNEYNKCGIPYSGMCCCCWVSKSCPTLCEPMDCSTPGFPVLTNSQSLLKLMSIELVTLSNPLSLCCSLLLLPSVFPSIRVFSSESALHIWWPKYWSFSFNVSPFSECSQISNEYSMNYYSPIKRMK